MVNIKLGYPTIAAIYFAYKEYVCEAAALVFKLWSPNFTSVFELDATYEINLLWKLPGELLQDPH